MALRKASSYSLRKARPFTRTSRKKSKAYIKTVPVSKIAKLNMGNQKDSDQGKHPFVVKYVSEMNMQVRDNALEACRMFIHKVLEEQVPGQYFLNVKVYPHHLLRENKTAAGAGADRISSGMKHSYGIVIGRAAMVKNGSDIFVISCANDKAARCARKALQQISSKMPAKGRVVMDLGIKNK